MSLIQAALDKAGRTQTQAKNTTEVAAKAAEPAAAVPRPAQADRVWQRSILDDGLERKLREAQRNGSARRLFELKIGAGVVLLAIVAAVLPFLKGSSKSRASQSSPQSVSVAVSGPVSAVLSPLRGRDGHLSNAVSPDGSYLLSGVTDMGDGPRAVINNEIFAEGDMVSRDALVKKIAGKEVLLEVRGKEISLKLE